MTYLACDLLAREGRACARLPLLYARGDSCSFEQKKGTRYDDAFNLLMSPSNLPIDHEPTSILIGYLEKTRCEKRGP